MMIYRKFIKQILDFLLAFLFLIILLPLFLIISLCIKIASPRGPVFFKHNRVGENGKPFGCLKFRTMIPDAEKKLNSYLANNPKLKKEFEANFKLKNDPRVIPLIGKFLRTSSFDELPQFINVLRQEMSIIGPRPIVKDEIPKYSTNYQKLITVRPGITGLWQTSGRNDINYANRVQLDMQYIDSVSFKNDFLIALKTIKVILQKRGY